MNDIINEMKTKDKRIVVIKNHSSFIYFMINNDRIERVYKENLTGLNLGDFVVGKVLKFNKGINGYFVKINDELEGFLASDEVKYNIKIGDELLLMVKKEAYDNKLAYLTTNLEIKGKYSICSRFSSNAKKLTISKKISADKRKEYESISEYLGEFYGNLFFTIRTAADKIDIDELRTDLDNISGIMTEIIKIKAHASLYSILYKNSIIGDILTDHGFDIPIITDDKEIYSFLYSQLSVKKFNCNLLQLYEDDSISLLNLYGLKKKTEELLKEKVWLKSGGYLFISETPALIAIDVNYGKANHKADKESASLQTNLEAAKEIVYQIGARNLSGVIVIDFINLKKEESKNILIESFKMLSKTIKPEIRYSEYSKLGFIEATREKKYININEIFKDDNKNILL